MTSEFCTGEFRCIAGKKSENKDNRHGAGSYKIKKRSYKVKKTEKEKNGKEVNKR